MCPRVLVASFLAVFLVACSNAGNPVPAANETASPGISDGAHGGNAAFYFLPPLVAAPAPTGVFDGSLEPTVVICAWSGTECALPSVVEFTTGDGGGSETIRVEPLEQHYVVNWHTKRFALAGGQIYRIRVTLPAVELGHLDVVMVAGGGGRGTAPAGAVPLVNGRTVPIKFRIEEGARDAALRAFVASSTVPVPRADACGRLDGRTCESRIGDVVADAMRLTHDTDFAVMNSGGMRADLTCPETDLPGDFCPAFSPPPYPITRGEVLSVLPFGNRAVTVSVDGAELRAMLENGVSQMPAAAGRFPEVSGLCFTYAIDAAAGSRVTGAVRQAADGGCSGPALDLTSTTSYTLALNDFMASGGDGYPVVIARATLRGVLDEVVAAYLGELGTISPAIQGRIVCTTAGMTACPVVTP
jgi:hypothetical protein